MKVARLFVHMILFFLSFSIEVRVQAGEVIQIPEASSVQQIPLNCLQTRSICAIGTQAGEKYSVALGKSKIVLDEKSTAIIKTQERLVLVSGTVWVQAKNRFFVQTEYGEVSGEDGDFWVWKDKNRTWVAAGHVDVSVFPRGGSEMTLPRAMQNWLSRVGSNGAAEVGIPVAANLDLYLARWARLFYGSKSAFSDQAKRFFTFWQTASDDASKIHRELLDRKVAALREEHEKKEAQRKSRERHNLELQNIFRSKVLEDQ